MSARTFFSFFAFFSFFSFFASFASFASFEAPAAFITMWRRHQLGTYRGGRRRRRPRK